MTLDDFTPLTEAEQAVIAKLGTGHVTVLGDGTLPGEAAGEDRQVRASLTRCPLSLPSRIGRSDSTDCPTRQEQRSSGRQNMAKLASNRRSLEGVPDTEG